VLSRATVAFSSNFAAKATFLAKDANGGKLILMARGCGLFKELARGVAIRPGLCIILIGDRQSEIAQDDLVIFAMNLPAFGALALRLQSALKRRRLQIELHTESSESQAQCVSRRSSTI
jgi:hypothetical protein